MKSKSYRYILISILSILILNTKANCQVRPDNTLGIENSVVQNGILIKGKYGDLVTGGALRGINLFHSFIEFNVNNGNQTYFFNPSGIKNIITRVTGTNASNINGTLGVFGNADLILLNPNGIIFGKGSSLDINGALLATSASSLRFLDGSEFNAVRPNSIIFNASLENPISLVFNQLPGSIEVNGEGSDITFDFFGNVLGAGKSSSGLRVNSGSGITLIGGDINLNGGLITAESGHIELGSIGQGTVSITRQLNGWFGKYNNAFQLKNISIANNSVLDTSGTGYSNIFLVGNDINIVSGSYILNEFNGIGEAGEIDLYAKNKLSIVGNTNAPSDVNIAEYNSGILSRNISGKGSNINLVVSNLEVLNSGIIFCLANQSGLSGNINIDSKETVTVSGYSTQSPIINISLISSTTFGDGQGGDVTINTKSLKINKGATVSTANYDNGNSGSIFINASKEINIDGFNRDSETASLISSIAFGNGNSGNINIQTGELSLINGGEIGALTLKSGNSGRISINANNIFISDNNSAIISGAVIGNESLLDLLGLPQDLIGKSGEINITANTIKLTNAGQITVQNQGAGDAGELSINSNFLVLDSGSSISASTRNGSGGNISIQSGLIALRDRSFISTSALNVGLGGNIGLFTNVLLGGSTSSVIANAQENRGGNINISASKLVLSPDFKISSSSQLGEELSGTIGINNQSGSLQSYSRVDPKLKIASKLISCASENGEVKYIGTGNIPQDLSDSIEVLEFTKNRPVQSSLLLQDEKTNKPVRILEGSSLRKNVDGTISLTRDTVGIFDNEAYKIVCLNSGQSLQS